MSGAFAKAAADLAGAGLAVIPLGGCDGKVPLIKNWTRWKHRPGRDFIEQLINEYPEANVGAVCALSGVFLVDVDDTKLVGAMIERFGKTPLITGTPAGGSHLWYRSRGERCVNLRKSLGLAVDLKGVGGFVAVPPSVRPPGDPFAGHSYVFLSGSWRDLARLPTIRPHSFPGEPAGGDVAPLRSVKVGHRNDTLFRTLLRQVRHCDDFETLLDVGATINANSFDPPLSAEEVKKVAASAWDYETTDRNWVGSEQRMYMRRSEWEALAVQASGGDACLLFAKLRMAHWDHFTFSVSPRGMTEAGTVPGWGLKRYKAALSAILASGLLAEVYHGGRGAGDASRFAFSGIAQVKGVQKGTLEETNITETLPRS